MCMCISVAVLNGALLHFHLLCLNDMDDVHDNVKYAKKEKNNNYVNKST